MFMRFFGCRIKIFCLFALGSTNLFASESPLIKGDQLFENRHIAANAFRALELYGQTSPKDAISLSRESMVCQFIGHRIAKTEEEKLEYFERGVTAGRKSLALDPNCAPCLFWTAINLALVGKVKGPLSTLRSLKEIRALLTKAKEIDPAYAQGGPDRVLGTIEAAIPKIIGGDRFKARQYFENSIYHAPQEAMNYLALAKLWEEAYNDPAQARDVAKAGLAQPMPHPNQIESVESRQELAQMLSRLSNSHSKSAEPTRQTKI